MGHGNMTATFLFGGKLVLRATRRIAAIAIPLAVLVLAGSNSLLAQTVESPDSKQIFREDSALVERIKKEETKEVLKIDQVSGSEVEFEAPKVTYDQESDTVFGAGGVQISKQDLQVQADQGRLNNKTQDGEVQGRVLFATPQAQLGADFGSFNMERETGTFGDANLMIEEGGYKVAADRLDKISEFEFQYDDGKFTTCHCSDGSCPWTIHSSDGNVTQGGYAHTYNAWLEFFGVPLFYTPYLAFPVKDERQSGLLVPKFGYGSEDGFMFAQPIFAVIDDQTDTTLTPFVETQTRVGLMTDVRHIFSMDHKLEGRFLYSDERLRGDSLRGSNVQGLNDPTFDEDRVGVAYRETWNSSAKQEIPLGFVADIHYISDDLLPREIEEAKIIDPTARYSTSVAVGRAALGDYGSAELVGEYNQAIESDDDTMFQRLPEASLNLAKSFRPFGYNPFGLKFVPKMNLLATEFDRKTGFDGNRVNFNPGFDIPFRYHNFFASKLAFNFVQTNYDTNRPDDVSSGEDPITDDSRSIWAIDYELGTSLERIFDLDPGNWLSTLTGMGLEEQGAELKRVKHVIEPFAKYRYIPDEDQDSLPLYDSLDRIRHRDLITYGVRTTLLGRFVSSTSQVESIEEIAPRVEDLPLLLGSESSDGVGGTIGLNELTGGRVGTQQGGIRNLSNLLIRQSYDRIEARDDISPNEDQWSDLGIAAGLFPTRQAAIVWDSTLDTDTTTLTSWGMQLHLLDDRGDAIRARYSYIEDGVSQLTSGVEVAITDLLKLGYFTRFDNQQSDFIENRAALRLYSSCNCWKVDLGYADQTNPDQQSVLLTLTLVGLGDVNQGMSRQLENP